MQEMDSTICGEINTLDSKQLIDNRDGKSYWVTKLRDDNCWMTQNLALDLYNANITKDNSDITAATWTEAKAIQSGLWSDTAANTIGWYAYPTEQNVGHASYGNYYTWQAATAGTGSSVTTTEASGSICPKNWKLPSPNQFTQLVTGLTLTEIKTTPYYFIAGGYVTSGKLNSAGASGYYWSSMAYGTGQAYYLDFGSSGINPSYYASRYRGYSVRCLVLGS